MAWQEKNHPRDGDGRFTESWVGEVSARLPGGDDRVYYHGTVEPGLRQIQPGRVHGKVVFPHVTDPDFAYANPELSSAYHYAELAYNAAAYGRPRVYKVRATGPIEEDPSHNERGDSRSTMPGDIRSRHRFEVIEEMPAPDWWVDDDEENYDWDEDEDLGPSHGGSDFSIFDHLIDPAFGDPSEYNKQMAHEWASEHFDYGDAPTRYEIIADETEHGGDGVTVKGSFLDDGGQNVGQWEFSILTDENGDRAIVVDTISIDKPYRGNGVAKRWVKHLEEIGRREGVKRITMWDQSSGFWESRGYTASFQGAFKTSEKML